jgi:hypothetical protein
VAKPREIFTCAVCRQAYRLLDRRELQASVPMGRTTAYQAFPDAVLFYRGKKFWKSCCVTRAIELIDKRKAAVRARAAGDLELVRPA